MATVATTIGLDPSTLWVTCRATLVGRQGECTMRIRADEHQRWTSGEGNPEMAEWHSEGCPDRVLLTMLWDHIRRLQRVYPDAPVPDLLRKCPDLMRLVG